MKEKLAILVSGLSSPFVTLTVFGIWVIIVFSTSKLTGLLWIVLFFTCIILLPLGYILLRKAQGKITDIHVAIREQRNKPFVLATLGAILLYIAYIVLHAPTQLITLAATFVICGIIFGLITRFWKISMHSGAYVGAVTVVAHLINPRLFWLLLFLPVILWARYTRKRHNISQVLVAALIVFLCISAVLYISQ